MTAEICAVMPFWSQAGAMNWDSNYAYLRRVLPLLSRALPDWLWVVTWPQRSKGADAWHWYDDGLFSERIVPFPWPYSTQMRSSISAWDPDRFRQLDDGLAPTVYWLHQVEAGVTVQGGYQASFNRSARPAIVAQHHYVIHDSLPYPVSGLFARLWLQMGGSIVADRVVLNSQHTLRMMRDTFATYLHPEQLAAIEHKSQVIPFGLVDDALADLPITPRDGLPPVIVYNHRFENYKQPKVTAEVLLDLRREGRTFEVWCTQTAQQKVALFPVDRVVGHPEQHVYLRNIAVPGINTINSVHETFCISALDSLALGQLLVAPNAITFPELVPPGYPFLFNSIRQQRDILAHLLDTWPVEYERWHARLRAHARSQFGIDRYIAQYADVLVATAGAYFDPAVAKDSTRASIDAYARKLPPGRYKLDDVAGKLRASANLASQSLPNRRVIRELSMRGAQVMYEPSSRSVLVSWSPEAATRGRVA